MNGKNREKKIDWGTCRKYFLTLSLIGVLGLNINWEQDSNKDLRMGFSELASGGGGRYLITPKSIDKVEKTYEADVHRDGKDFTLRSEQKGDTTTIVFQETQAQDCTDCVLRSVTLKKSGTDFSDINQLLDAIEKQSDFFGKNKVKKISSSKEEDCSASGETSKMLKCGVDKCLELIKVSKKKLEARQTILNCYKAEISGVLEAMWREIRRGKFEDDELSEFRDKIAGFIDRFDHKLGFEVREKLAKLLAKTYKVPGERSLEKALKKTDIYERERSLVDFHNLFKIDESSFSSYLSGFREENHLSQDFARQLYLKDYFCPVNSSVPVELKVFFGSMFNPSSNGIGNSCNSYKAPSLKTSTAQGVSSSLGLTGRGSSTGINVRSLLGKPKVN